jgi:hypothetical protein
MNVGLEYRLGARESGAIDGKLWYIIPEIFCIFMRIIYEPQEQPEALWYHDAVLFSPAGLSLSVYKNANY